MKFAFPISTYLSTNNTTGGRNVTMQSISSTLRETMNPRDIMTDALHNFHPQYTQYSSDNKRFQGPPAGQPSEQQNNNMNVAPVPVPTNPIDISDTGDQEKVKSRKTKNNEKALLLSDD